MLKFKIFFLALTLAGVLYVKFCVNFDDLISKMGIVGTEVRNEEK